MQNILIYNFEINTIWFVDNLMWRITFILFLATCVVRSLTKSQVYNYSWTYLSLIQQHIVYIIYVYSNGKHANLMLLLRWLPLISATARRRRGRNMKYVCVCVIVRNIKKKRRKLDAHARNKILHRDIITPKSIAQFIIKLPTERKLYTNSQYELLYNAMRCEQIRRRHPPQLCFYFI